MIHKNLEYYCLYTENYAFTNNSKVSSQASFYVKHACDYCKRCSFLPAGKK